MWELPCRVAQRALTVGCLLSFCLCVSLLPWVAADGNSTSTQAPICSIEHCLHCKNETACGMCNDYFLETSDGGCVPWCLVENCYACHANDSSICILCIEGYKVEGGSQCVSFVYSDSLDKIGRDGAVASGTLTLVATAIATMVVTVLVG